MRADRRDAAQAIVKVRTLLRFSIGGYFGERLGRNRSRRTGTQNEGLEGDFAQRRGGACARLRSVALASQAGTGTSLARRPSAIRTGVRCARVVASGTRLLAGLGSSGPVVASLASSGCCSWTAARKTLS